MKALIRGGFATLIVLGIVIQATHGRHGNGGGDPMAALAASLERLNVRTDGTVSPAGILTGRAPSCAAPVRVLLSRIDGADAERIRALPASDEATRYVYLGMVAETRDRAAMIGRWVWASIRFTVGLRSYKPLSEFVLVMLPRACPDLAALDWAALSPAD